MYQDAQTQLWNAAALTASAVSTNAYDLLPAAITGGPISDPSPGVSMVVIITVGVAAKTSVGDETYEFDVVQADDAALTVNLDTLAKYPMTNAQAVLLLKKGAIIVAPIPQGTVTREFLGAKFISAGTGPTITVTAWIAPSTMIQMYRNYGTKIIVL